MTKIERLGGSVRYDYHLDTDADGVAYVKEGVTPDDNLITRLLGRDYWHRVVIVRGYRLRYWDSMRPGGNGTIFHANFVGPNETTFAPNKKSSVFRSSTDRYIALLRDIGPLVSLNLSDTAVTDQGLSQLECLKGLKYLHLGNTATTDAGLDSIANIPGLEAVALWFTPVSDEGLKELQAQSPDLAIWHQLTTEWANGARVLTRTCPKCEFTPTLSAD